MEGNFDVLDHAVLVNEERGLVVPQRIEESRLIHRIEDNSMPPEEEEEFPRMSSGEMEVLKKWVAGGAPAFPGPGPHDQPAPDQGPTKAAIAVKEIFRDNCYECHRLGNAKNGIKILNHDLLIAKRKVVVPGSPDRSRLFQSLSDPDPKKVMPPPEMPSLTADEIDTIRRWIGEGLAAFSPRTQGAGRTAGAIATVAACGLPARAITWPGCVPVPAPSRPPCYPPVS